MKSVITAFVIFILIVVMMILSYVYVNSVTDNMLACIYKVENEFSKELWESSHYETEKLSKVWKNSRIVMSALYSHQLIDEVDKSVGKLKNSVKTRKKEDFLYEKSNLILLISRLVEQQKITVGNVL